MGEIFDKKVFYKNPVFILMIMLLGVAILSYLDFIGTYRIYGLVGDIRDQFLPEQQGILDLIKESGIPMWSFYRGLGQQALIGNPNWSGDIFSLIPMIFGRENIQYFYGIIAVIKIFLSGIFFYKFLKELKVADFTSVIFSFLYAFNGHMICRGMWIHYATEVVFVALMLWSLERYYRNKKILFPLALALLFLSRNAAYVYIYSGIPFLYIILRYSFDNGLDIKGMFVYVVKFIPYYILGLGISAVLIMPGIYYLLLSPRTEGAKLYLTNPFKINDILSFITVFLKSFSYSIMGAANTTGSSSVILEDQVLYCGIFTMLIFPQIFGFKNAPKKEKNIIYILLGLIAIYYIFPYARYFLNAFSSIYYKTSSFWSIVFLILSGVYVLNNIEKQHETFNINIFIKTLSFYLILFFAIFITNRKIIELKAFIFVIIIMLILSSVILKIKDINYKRCFILLICVFEISIGVKMEIGSDEFLNINPKNSSELLYDTELQKTVKDLQNYDDDFYRIITDNLLVNNSERYRYMGTEAYISLTSKSLDKIYNLFDLLKSTEKVQNEFNDRVMLNTMVGVKYFIRTNQSSDIPEGFELEFESNGYEVYKNTQYLPLGYVYNEYIPEEIFEEFDNDLKDFFVLNSAVINSDTIDKVKQNEINVKENEKYVEKQTSYELSYKNAINLEILENDLPESISYYSINNDPQIIFNVDGNRIKQKYTLNLDIESETDTGGQLYFSYGTEGFSGNKMVVFSVNKGENNYKIEFTSEEPVTDLRVDIGDVEGNYSVSNIKLESIDYVTYEEYTDSVDELRNNPFNIEYFSQNKIVGNVDSNEDGILFFSIPNDSGWSLKIDGVDTDISEVNGGFIGAPIKAGQHSIELKYMLPFLVPGAIITCICIVGLCFVYYIRKKQDNN